MDALITFDGRRWQRRIGATLFGSGVLIGLAELGRQVQSIWTA